MARLEIPEPASLQVEVVQAPFDTHARQMEFSAGHRSAEGLGVSVWMPTNLITDRLQQAIARVPPPPPPPPPKKDFLIAILPFMAGYRIPFRYCVFWDGPSPGTVLPPPNRLVRHANVGRYVDDGHTQDLVLSGPLRSAWKPGAIPARDDRKPTVPLRSGPRSVTLRLEVAKLNATAHRKASLPLRTAVRRLLLIAPVSPFC